MRKWTWMVLVASGSLAWACGGDDSGSDDDDDGTTTTGGSGGTAGSGGTDPTTSGGSGGSGGTSPTTTGSGGTNPTTTGAGGTSPTTTGSGGSAGEGGESGAAGAAGADGSSGGTGGTNGGVTVESACADSCAAQSTSDCPDEANCEYFCVLSATIFPACEAEYLAQQGCYATLEGDDWDCETGYPFPAAGKCEDETAQFNACAL